jgi:hypothetical protein
MTMTMTSIAMLAERYTTARDARDRACAASEAMPYWDEALADRACEADGAFLEAERALVAAIRFDFPGHSRVAVRAEGRTVSLQRNHCVDAFDHWNPGYWAVAVIDDAEVITLV